MNSLLQKAVVTWAWFSAVCLVGAVGTLLLFLLVKGLPAFSVQLIFGDAEPLRALLFQERVFDGLFPAIVGTLLLVFVSVIWAVPVGVATGIYMAEYAGENARNIFDLFYDILAGIPSIVIGLFGFSLAIFLHKHFSDQFYPCFLISTISLAFLVLPYIIRSTQVALQSIPQLTRNTVLALGASKMQNIFHVLLPQSISGIGNGIILAIGRCAEDTAVIMLTGAVATAGVPRSLLSQYEALPFYIFYISAQYTSQEELMTGYAASLILITLCLFLFSLSFLIRKKISYLAFNRL